MFASVPIFSMSTITNTVEKLTLSYFLGRFLTIFYKRTFNVEQHKTSLLTEAGIAAFLWLQYLYFVEWNKLNICVCLIVVMSSFLRLQEFQDTKLKLFLLSAVLFMSTSGLLSDTQYASSALITATTQFLRKPDIIKVVLRHIRIACGPLYVILLVARVQFIDTINFNNFITILSVILGLIAIIFLRPDNNVMINLVPPANQLRSFQKRKVLHGVCLVATLTLTSAQLGCRSIIDSYFGLFGVAFALANIGLFESHLFNSKNVYRPTATLSYLFPIVGKLYMILYSALLNTDLCMFLEERPFGLHPQNVKLLLFQLLRGLRYIHQKQILHRDIKPQNVLLSIRGDLKLADFGLARAKSVPSRTYTNEIVTLWYRPPDVLLGSTHYTTSLDIWGVGCIFVEMISGFPLFPGVKSARDQLDKIFKVCGTPNISQWPDSRNVYNRDDFNVYSKRSLPTQAPRLNAIPHAEALADKMLQFEPRNRVSALEGMNDKYFSDLPKAILTLPNTTSIFVIPGLQMQEDHRRPDLMKTKRNSKTYGHFV